MSRLNVSTVQRNPRSKEANNPEYKLHHAAAEETLGTAIVRRAVRCPHNIPVDEWIMSRFMQIFDEYQHVITIADGICVDCKQMSAGPGFLFAWADDDDHRPRPLSAIEYMRELQHYTYTQLTTEKLVKRNQSGCVPGFRKRLQTILRRMFRVYAHLYLEHYRFLHKHSLVAHLNVYFKHFLFYVSEFDLVSMEEMAPMALLIQNFQEMDEEERARGGQPNDSCLYCTE